MSKHTDDPTTLLHQDSISQTVWNACDTFRGKIDANDYKNFVLTMLFLKYISDIWQDRHDFYVSQHGNDPAKIALQLKNERFVLPPDASFYSLHALRMTPGNGERIDRALKAIEDSNQEKLRGVFQDTSFNSIKLGEEPHRNNLLRRLLEDFYNPALDLRPSKVGNLDVIGNAYEFLIKNFASGSGKKAGEFYTPPEISMLMADLADPQVGDDISDPTCGSGALLLKCGQRIRTHHNSTHYALFGQEMASGTWALAKMNMFLHGQDKHRIEWGDTIRDPKLLDADGRLKQFDVVVANPPFSLETWGHEIVGDDPFGRFYFGKPPKSKADFAFILHMIHTMKPVSGRAVVVVPLGVLTRSGSENHIRKQIIDANLLDAVIGLPKNLFYGTGIAAAILIFRNTKSDGNVLFINASAGFQHGKKQNSLRQEDADRIMGAYHKRARIEHFAYLANNNEIAANQYSLSIPLYVNTYVPEAKIDLPAVAAEISALWTESNVLHIKMMDKLKELRMI